MKIYVYELAWTVRVVELELTIWNGDIEKAKIYRKFRCEGEI